MLILTMISFLIGVVLGLRFKVLILIPIIGLALGMVAVHGIAVEDGVWWLVGKMVVVATFLQLGYVGGSILQFGVCATRAGNGRASVSTTSTAAPSSGQSQKLGGASGRFEASKQLRQA
jgi:hypothetical protein